MKMRKKIVAARDLPAGHCSAAADLALKSPGDGLPPYELDRVVGRTLKKPMVSDETLTFEHLDELIPAVRRSALDRDPSHLEREMTFDLGLEGRVAIVTGALGKLGPVWTEALERAGRNRRQARPEGRRPATSTGGRDRPRGARGGPRAVRHAVRPCQQRRNRPAAGGGRAHVPIEDVPLADFRRTVDVNLVGAFNAIQVFGSAMRDAGRGSIVNIGSLYASIAPEPAFYDHMEADPRSSSRRHTARPRPGCWRSRAISRGSGGRMACA